MSKTDTTAQLTAHIQRLVDNPFEADGEFYHQRLSDPTYSGKITLTSNEMTRIGALCFLQNRLPHHEMSAARFKSEYEALYGSVSPAVDPEREPVDTSPIAHDAGMAARIDNGRSIRLVIHGDDKADIPAVLDKNELDLILTCVCMGIASSDLVPKVKGRPDWRMAQARNHRILHALDRLSRHWGYSGEKAA